MIAVWGTGRVRAREGAISPTAFGSDVVPTNDCRDHLGTFVRGVRRKIETIDERIECGGRAIGWSPQVNRI